MRIVSRAGLDRHVCRTSGLEGRNFSWIGEFAGSTRCEENKLLLVTTEEPEEVFHCKESPRFCVRRLLRYSTMISQYRLEKRAMEPFKFCDERLFQLSIKSKLSTQSLTLSWAACKIVLILYDPLKLGSRKPDHRAAGWGNLSGDDAVDQSSGPFHKLDASALPFSKFTSL